MTGLPTESTKNWTVTVRKGKNVFQPETLCLTSKEAEEDSSSNNESVGFHTLVLPIKKSVISRRDIVDKRYFYFYTSAVFLSVGLSEDRLFEC